MSVRLSLAVALLCGLISTAHAQDMPQSTLAVMNIVCGGLNTSEELMLYKKLCDELSATGMYSVMDKTARDNKLQEQGISSAKPCVENSCLSEAGQILGTQKIVGGSVSRYGFTWRVDIRLIDVGTGSEEQQVSRSIEGDLNEYLAATKLIAEKLSGKGVVFPAPASNASPAGTKSNLTFEQINQPDKQARLAGVGIGISGARATALKPGAGGKLLLNVELPADNLSLLTGVEGWVNSHQRSDTSFYDQNIAWETGLDIALRWQFLGEMLISPFAGAAITLYYHNYEITRIRTDKSLVLGKDGRIDIGISGIVGAAYPVFGPVNGAVSLEGRAAFNRPALKLNIEFFLDLGKKEVAAEKPEAN